jgi:hypothetical protein
VDRFSIPSLIAEHRAIEARLDSFAEMVRSGEFDTCAVRELVVSIARHYEAEERFLAALAARDPKLAAKLQAQHDEASELGARLLESLESRDAVYLARRLLAIAQHNIIEEERDIFPVADRL